MEYANGKSGDHIRITVPIGTIIRDNSTNEIIGELNEYGQELIVAQGGTGGRGNAASKFDNGAMVKASPPQGGEKKWIKLELKLVADVVSYINMTL